MHFDELFDTQVDQELDRMVTNLDMLMDFMQTGLKNRGVGKSHGPVKARRKR